MKGFRSIASWGAVVALSILDQVGAIDLKAILAAFGFDAPSQASVVAMLGLGGIILRAVTSTPLGKSEPKP